MLYETEHRKENVQGVTGSEIDDIVEVMLRITSFKECDVSFFKVDLLSVSVTVLKCKITPFNHVKLPLVND